MSSKTKSTATKEGETSALVPKLRFPEFRETKWDKKKIGIMLMETSRPIELEDATEYNLVTVKRRYGGLVSRGKLKGREIKVTTQFLVHEGDFLISKRQIVHDACGLVPETLDGAVVSNEYSVLTPKAGCSVEFINWFAQQPCVSRSFLQCSVGIVIEKMLFKLDAWLKREFLFPGLPEQQKIAECLSSVDELLAAQARKVDALKTHKKGLMQQLFPREGETQPARRFPEFQNAGEWEPKLLQDVAKSFKTGKLDANAMVENGQYRFYTCAKNYYQIDTYAFEGEALLVAGNGAHLGYIHHYIGKFNAYQRTYVLQQFKANVVFLRYLLDRYLPARIQLEKKDGNTPYIVLSTLTEMPLVIPRDTDEQQRIADCLSKLDALIAAETQKLEALKTHKKGLMQQLFPSSEEVAA